MDLDFLVAIEETVSGNEIATIHITEVLDSRSVDGETADFSIEIIVDKGSSVGAYHRTIKQWPIKAFNSLGLLKAIITQLDTDTLEREEAEGDANDNGTSAEEATGTPALARQLNRVVREVQTGES